MWTEERTELLKQRWADGGSCSQIAAEIGGVSRNAVIGKVHRLGLSGRKKSPPPQPKQVRKRRLKANPVQFARFELEESFSYEPSQIGSTAFGEPCSIFELTRHTCRWPIGVPGSSDFFFCGAEPNPTRPYCPAHSRISCQRAIPLTEARKKYLSKVQAATA